MSPGSFRNIINKITLQWGLSTLAKELSAAASVMQSSSKDFEHSGSR